LAKILLATLRPAVAPNRIPSVTAGSARKWAMTTMLTVEVIKGVYCDWPRIESDEAIMVAGSYRPLEDAYRIATRTW
jgi:acetamidase/formamidase